MVNAGFLVEFLRVTHHDLHGCRQVSAPATPAFPTSLSVRNGGRVGPVNAPCNTGISDLRVGQNNDHPRVTFPVQ